MDQPSLTQLKRKLWIAGLAIILFLFSALSFIKVLAAASIYSAWYGVPRMAGELADVNRRGDVFFLISVALVLLAAGCVTYFIQIEAISSDRFRLVARYVIALALSVVATGMLVWLLGSLGVGALPGAFSK
ncbi:MAG: hypothetical protein WBM24_21735 [Candidatus Sulfotelmatobacter sp.]